MIEVQILIAAVLVGMLFVLARISWTLKGILDVLSRRENVSAAQDTPARTSTAENMAQGPESAPAQTHPAIAHDDLQDIAAVIAVAARATLRSRSKSAVS